MIEQEYALAPPEKLPDSSDSPQSQLRSLKQNRRRSPPRQLPPHAGCQGRHHVRHRFAEIGDFSGLRASVLAALGSF